MLIVTFGPTVYRGGRLRYYVGMQPLVIEYLREHTLAQLEEEHGVCARPNARGDKFSLNYDQIRAKGGNLITDQCRGMVVRRTDFNEKSSTRGPIDLAEALRKDAPWRHVVMPRLEVLAWPMCRFYNFGDGHVAQLDWNDPRLRVYEKVDGTCIITYWDPLHGAWHCATRSVPEADLPIRGDSLEIGDMTFAQLFLKALVATREEVSGKPVDWPVDGPDKVVHLNKEVTYVFELVSRHNQVVVDYPDPRVYLLAARHLPTGCEIPIEEIRMEHVRRPRTWPLRDAVSVGAFVNAAAPVELEGAVACVPNGPSFDRMKIKNLGYVLAHRSKDTVTASPRNALEAIITERIDDVVPLVPKEVGDKMLQMQAAYAQLCKDIDSNFARFSALAAGERKLFAQQVIASGDWPPPHFNMWEGRADNAHAWIKSAREKGKLSDSALDVILARMAV